MKINWNDLVYSVLIGLVLEILLGFVNRTSATFLFLDYILILIIPVGFYLWRNQSDWNVTATVSFIHGFVLSALSWLLFAVIPPESAPFGLFISTFSAPAMVLIILPRFITGYFASSIVSFVAASIITTGIVAIALGCIAKYAIEAVPSEGTTVVKKSSRKDKRD